MPNVALSIHDMAEYLTTFLQLCKSHRACRDIKWNASMFHDVEPIMASHGIDADSLSSDRWGIFSDGKPSDVSGRWDCCTLTYNDDDDAIYNLLRVRSCPQVPRPLIGLCSHGSSLHRMGLANDGTAFKDERFAGLRRDKWISLHPRNARIFYEENDHQCVQVAIGIAFFNQYWWRVRIEIDGCPSLSMVTDPVGAREVFRLRDIPEGSTRRAALRNWVREHWRKRVTDPAECLKVRRHLRGATSFTCSGMRCTILPSPDDIAMNAEGRL